MGGFLSGLGSLMTGAGQGAAAYGQQIRGILESRRHEFAELFTHVGDNSIDPALRGTYYKLAGDLYSGKDMSKIAPAAIKALENHTQGNHDLAQLVGGPPTPPPPTPGPASLGQTPGTGTAAQPATSPVQPQQQAPLATPAQGGYSQLLSAPAGAAGGESAAAGVPASTAAATPPSPAAPSSASSAGLFDIPDIAGHPADYYMQTPEGRRMLQPFISNQAELSRAMQLNRYRAGVLHDSGVMDNPNLPAFIKATLPLEAAGINVPMAGMTGMMTARTRNVDASQLTPDQKKLYGIPADASGRFTADVDFQGNPIGRAVQGWAGVGTAYDNDGNLLQYNKNDPTSIEGITAPNGEATRALGRTMQENSQHVMTNAQGQKIFVTPKTAAMFGGQTGGIDPSMLPTVHDTQRLVTTTAADGSAVQEFVPVRSVSQRGSAASTVPSAAGGASATSVPSSSAGGGRIFPKPLTPEQQIKAQQQIGQFDTAITRAKSVIGNIHLLDSMIDAGKMELQLHDGLLTNLVNRNMKLTPAEARMVTDFNSLTESVNLIRGALGATGFRGPEAFAALQAQRGKLLGNPEITKLTLQNLITEMEKQVNPLRKPATGKGPNDIPPVGGPAKAPKDMTDEEIIKQLMKG